MLACNNEAGKMNGKAAAWMGSWCVALSLIGVSLAEKSTQIDEPASAMADTTAAEPAQDDKQPSAAEIARSSCVNQCRLADGKCNSEVRRARQECSRNAANSGRDPMTMRNNDYTYFCSYFRNPGRRGPGNFDARFNQHYNLCIDLMQQNITSMRFDCYRSERDAQNICRAELRECQAACR